MIKRLKQQIRGYVMPEYLIEILTNHYAEGFLPMTILRQGDSYMFSYDTGYYGKIDLKQLSSQEKRKLVLSVIRLNEDNEDHLIAAERYLIEPELLYKRGLEITERTLRLLYYPDFKSQAFSDKLLCFLDRLDSGEDWMQRVRSFTEGNEIESAARYLEKRLM